jgi:hypothetical protein
MFLFAFLIAAAAQPCAAPSSEVSRQLILTYERFDTNDGEFGWRQLSARGCTDAALSLLARYETAQADRLGRDQRSEMAFHSGQALAFAGRDREALPHFERALAFGGTEEWKLYVEAHVAFVRHDSASLKDLRARYARVAPKSMRLKFLDGFVACPNDRYMKAAHCAM